MAKGTFVGLDLADLTALKTEYVKCLTAIATAGQSYSIQGRQFNRANLADVQNTLSEINYALGLANNTVRTMTVAGFGTPYSS
jgi:hypothetical protein